MASRPARDEVLEQALSTRMAVTRIADAIGISRAAVSQWPRVPEKHLGIVSKLTRISKRRLRPDLYPPRRNGA